jgi:hypothetical protein
VRAGSRARTTISPGHQITIPVGPFNAASLFAGDRLEVVAEAEGVVRIERVHRVEPTTTQAELPTC